MKFSNMDSPYIIAEIGANHNGDMDLARKMIASAKELGCDCVKFQSFDTDLFAREVYNQGEFLDDGRDVESDLKRAVQAYSVSAAELAELSAYCAVIGIDFASSVFEPRQAEELALLDPVFIKVASMDVNNDYLLRAVAKTGKPILLSTGMASMEEIAHAIETLEAESVEDLALLHCVSVYPPEDDIINLNNMEMLASAFGYPVGFSDHTKGTAVPLAAVAKGACIIEKHFTLDHSMEGWDHAMSSDPAEMGSLVSDARRIHVALGSSRRILSEKEKNMRTAMRRSVVSARDIPAGKVIEPSDLTYKRPGTGLEPNWGSSLIGMRAMKDIPADSLIRLQDLGVEVVG